jgi:hypothetical protein
MPRLRDQLAPFAAIACLFAGWAVIVQWIADAAAVDLAPLSRTGAANLHGFFSSVGELPSLARWDSVWYFSMAAQGYPGPAGTLAERNANFFPLYGLAMRALSWLLRVDFLRAGLWIARLSTLGALAIAYLRARDHGWPDSRRWALLTAMLAYPGAFLLIAVYSESMFLLLVLATFWLADRRRHGLAGATAALAALTRVHGVALLAALVVHALVRRREDRAGWRSSLWPAAGALVGGLAVPAWTFIARGDPLLYFNVKPFFIPPSMPSRSLSALLSSPWLERETASLARLTWSVQWFIIVATVVVGVGLVRARRALPEATFLLASVALSVAAGSFWGFLRYGTFLFPLHAAAARLHERVPWWVAALMISTLIQAAMLVHYVSFTNPAP